MARAGKKNAAVRQKALDLVRYLPPKDWLGQVHALWEYVKDSIRYVRDIQGVETLTDAQQTMEQGQGDCDDKAILLAALLNSIGHPARFVAVGFKPNDFVHVLVQTPIGTRWVWLETTEAVNMGWRPPGIQSVMVENV